MTLIRLNLATPNFDIRLAYVNVFTAELAIEFIDSVLYQAQHRQSIYSH